MIPLYDENDCRRFPIVNTLLIIVNIVAFGFEIAAGGSMEKLLMQYGTISTNVVHHFDLHQFLTLFTSCFLHAGLAHLVGNLWVLYLFGDNVEDKLGRFNYLGFYLLCGVLADASQILSNPTCTMPSIGASGAIAGVLGAYLILFPDVRVKLFINWLWHPMVPAWVVMGGWFLLQCVSTLIPSAGVESIAWFAHIGGFVAGLTIVAFLREQGKIIIDDTDILSVPCSKNPDSQIKYIPRLGFGPIFAAIIVGVSVGCLLKPHAQANVASTQPAVVALTPPAKTHVFTPNTRAKATSHHNRRHSNHHASNSSKQGAS